jgi:hypothetical protein
VYLPSNIFGNSARELPQTVLLCYLDWCRAPASTLLEVAVSSKRTDLPQKNRRVDEEESVYESSRVRQTVARSRRRRPHKAVSRN